MSKTIGPREAEARRRREELANAWEANARNKPNTGARPDSSSAVGESGPAVMSDSRPGSHTKAALEHATATAQAKASAKRLARKARKQEHDRRIQAGYQEIPTIPAKTIDPSTPPKPWTTLGISKATYFRRKSKENNA